MGLRHIFREKYYRYENYLTFKTQSYPMSIKARLLMWYAVQKQALRLSRSTEPIKVAFLLNEIGAWKTESLYLDMLKHSRLNPLLVVIDSEEVKDASTTMISFLKSKGYAYKYVPAGDTLEEHDIKPDVVFYEKPYPTSIHRSYWPTDLRKTLYCFVSYGFHNFDVKWAFSQPFSNICWKVFYENKDIEVLAQQHMENKWNSNVTGVPMMDALLTPKDKVADPWKPQEKPKKRIIWAPHHTLDDSGLIKNPLSTFMKYADDMLELARRYADSVQWAFKPHPLLHDKLIKIWGKERTDNYYRQWADMPNTQLEDGEYLGLFKHSDAMIHDCGSFIVEYHYTLHPVMYLVNDGRDYTDGLSPLSKTAFLLHEQGRNMTDIEGFITNVINGVDAGKAKRKAYYESSLLPPNGRSACENILLTMLQPTQKERWGYKLLNAVIPVYCRFLKACGLPNAMNIV